MLLTVAGWSAIWDLNRGATRASLAFWLPLVLGLGLHLVLCYSTDETILGLRWSPVDIASQAWWRTVSFPVPLLMIATGYEAVLLGRSRGLVWIVCAALVARIGTIFLRRAEGVKFNETKAGELRNRAFAVARRMRTMIRGVYIVPSGKGHLTNAYGGSRVVAVTDNWGKYFTKPQLDYVLAHEVAHVKRRHGLKQFLLAIALYSVLTLVLFRLSTTIEKSRPLLEFLVIVAPIMALDLLSRHFEYDADREAVSFTGDPETAIRALVTLYKVSSVPIRCSNFAELFMTHPSLTHRAAAIARVGEFSAERVAEMLLGVDAPQVATSQR